MEPSIAALPEIGSRELRYDFRVLDWFQFERTVALLFDAEGFVVEFHGGANPDGGIDLIATKNGITFGIQCKHWKTSRVGIKEVRAFFGALHDHKLHHGFLVTVQGYTLAAANYAQRNGIELMDERALQRNLDDVKWRLNPAFAELLHDDRKICPKCESEMILRTTRNGAQAGQLFWGCSKFPRCRFTMPK